MLARQKGVQYSSRTGSRPTATWSCSGSTGQLLSLLQRLPDGDLNDTELALKRRPQKHPRITLLLLIPQQAAYEGQAKDYDFSAKLMREHWSSGYRDTQATRRRREWLESPADGAGIQMYDVHRIDD